MDAELITEVIIILIGNEIIIGIQQLCVGNAKQNDFKYEQINSIRIE